MKAHIMIAPNFRRYPLTLMETVQVLFLPSWTQYMARDIDGTLAIFDHKPRISGGYALKRFPRKRGNTITVAPGLFAWLTPEMGPVHLSEMRPYKAPEK